MAALALVAVVAAYALKSVMSGGRQSADFAAMLTPPGVTLTMVGTPVETEGVSRLRPYQDGDAFVDRATVFADGRGLPFYANDNESATGGFQCSGDCLAAWPPATAPADAQPTGDWSIVNRSDGLRQWAFKGKPLHLCARDETPGDAKGDGADGAWHVVIFKPGAAKTGDPVAAYRPSAPGAVPFGLAIREVEAAGGQVLTDELGRTIYAFDGDPRLDRPTCASGSPSGSRCGDSPFLPVAAPALASALGDFTIVRRADGTSQWAYKGQALYRYAGDSAAGQARGIGVDDRWRVAVVVRYPMPAPVTIRSTTMGRIFATQDGRSLYRQFLYYYSADAGNFEHGYPYNEIVGRLVGARGCVAECSASWRPFAAAPEAQPGGHWSIVTRDDGTRQWAYKGYALYTFVGDKKPGDLLGLDTWDVAPNDPALHVVSLFTRLRIDAESVTGMFFTTAYP